MLDVLLNGTFLHSRWQRFRIPLSVVYHDTFWWLILTFLESRINSALQSLGSFGSSLLNNLYQFRNRSLLFLIIYWQCAVTVWSGAEYWSLLTYRAVLYIWLGFHNFFIRWEIGVSRFRLGGLISKYPILLVNFLEKKGEIDEMLIMQTGLLFVDVRR